MQKLVLFQTGEMEFAIKLDCIEEIRPIPEGSILSRQHLQQTIEQKGDLILLIDLASETHHNSAPGSDAQLILVKGSPRYALLADVVFDTIEAEENQKHELPIVFENTARSCFPEVLCLRHQIFLIIDSQALGEIKVDTDSAPYIWHEKQSNLQIIEPDQETGGDLPPKKSVAPDVDSLDTKVGDILQKIIGQRVEQKVAETMAQTLEITFW